MLIEIESMNGEAKCPFCGKKMILDKKGRVKECCDHVVASCGKLFEEEFKVYCTSTVNKRSVTREI